MMVFIANNWLSILLVIVGSFALIIYILQERRKISEAAALIILQIDELEKNMREISSYIVDGRLNFTAFYESTPIMGDNCWDKYKYYFVRTMDSTSFSAITELYTYATEVLEQQILIKGLQKRHFELTQNYLMHSEFQAIDSCLNNAYKHSCEQSDALHVMDNLIPPSIPKDDRDALHNYLKQMPLATAPLDMSLFWKRYNEKKQTVTSIINQNAITTYTPEQIRISLEKTLKKCSMLSISGTSGYQLLRKQSKRRC